MRGMFILLVLAAASGCGAASASHVYRASTRLLPTGYSDRQVGEGVWEVTYHTGDTDRANYARQYALYRAAELASQAGFPVFRAVVTSETYMSGAGLPPCCRTVKMTVHGARSWDQARCTVGSCEAHGTDAALQKFMPVRRQGEPAAQDHPAPN